MVNYIYGKGAEVIEPMMNTGKINVLTLIASSRVADQLKSTPKVNRLRSILGLDAKTQELFLKDADLDLTVDECVAGSLFLLTDKDVPRLKFFCYTKILQMNSSKI